MASLRDDNTLSLSTKDMAALLTAIKRYPPATDDPAWSPVTLLIVALADIERGRSDRLTVVLCNGAEQAPAPETLDGEAYYRAICEKAGWCQFTDSDWLEGQCGDRDGIAHGPTVEGRVHENDSVYATWEACCLEACASLDDFGQGRAVAEGWCLMQRSDGRIAIQKDDEQAVFATDEDAERHVARHAGNGSAYHKHALAIADYRIGAPDNP